MFDTLALTVLLIHKKRTHGESCPRFTKKKRSHTVRLIIIRKCVYKFLVAIYFVRHATSLRFVDIKRCTCESKKPSPIRRVGVGKLELVFVDTSPSISYRFIIDSRRRRYRLFKFAHFRLLKFWTVEPDF